MNAFVEQIDNVKNVIAGKVAPKRADIRTDMGATPEVGAGQETGRDHFDKALRAGARTFRDSMLLGYGRDEAGFEAFFAPNSPQRKQFYALMAQYQSFEALRLADRFSK